jgi:hypothetical protein
MRREEILRNQGFYALKKDKSERWIHSAKLLEDEILYDEYNNWEKLVHYFNNPPFMDTGIGVSKESFNLWYAMISRYIEKKPDKKSIHIFLMKQRGLPKNVDEIVDQVPVIRENKKAVEILLKVKEELI